MSKTQTITRRPAGSAASAAAASAKLGRPAISKVDVPAVAARSAGNRDEGNWWRRMRAQMVRLISATQTDRRVFILLLLFIAVFYSATTMSKKHVIQLKYHEKSGKMYCPGVQQDMKAKGKPWEVVALPCNHASTMLRDIHPSGVNEHLLVAPGMFKFHGKHMCITGDSKQDKLVLAECKVCAEYAIAQHHKVEKYLSSADDSTCQGITQSGLEQVWQFTKDADGKTAVRNGARDAKGQPMNECMRFNGEGEKISLVKCQEEKDGQVVPAQSWFASRARVIWKSAGDA